MSLLRQPAQNLNSLEFIITSIGLISSHHLFTTFSHVKAARNVCKTLRLALHELTHRSRAERTMSYVERRRKGARVVTKARQWNVVHVVTVLRRHYDCIVKTTSLKKQFFQLCSKQHISATIFRNRFDPILNVFKKTRILIYRILSQGTLRKVSDLSINLVMLITLALLASCDVMGLSKLWRHVWSVLLLRPTPLLCLHLLKCDRYLSLSTLILSIISSIMTIGIIILFEKVHIVLDRIR